MYPTITNKEWLAIHDLAIKLRSALSDADRLCDLLEVQVDAQREEAWLAERREEAR